MNQELSNEQESDEALMEMLKRGEVAGFDLLVKRYQKPVVNYLYRLTGNFALAEDIAQDSFLMLYRKAKLFHSTGCFKSWFYKIVTNIFRQNLRKKKFDDKQSFVSSVILNDSEKIFVNQLQTPAQEIENKEVQSHIRKLISSLPEQQRIAVTLHIFDEFTYKEIADILKCSIGTVKSRIHYGLQTLKEKVIKMNLFTNRDF